MCAWKCVQVSSDGLQDGNGACCADWASADPHTPLSSSPQSWDLQAPGQRREGGTPPQSLKQSKRETKTTLSVLFLFQMS